MARVHLRRVAACRRELDAARDRFHEAIKKAVSSGETYRDVAEQAGLSYQRIAQIVQDGKAPEPQE